MLKTQCDLYGPCNNPDGCWWCLPKNTYDKLRRECVEAINGPLDKAFIDTALEAQERDRNRPTYLHLPDAHTGRPCVCGYCRVQIAGLMVRIFPRTAKRWIQLRPNTPMIMLDELGHIEGYVDPLTLRPLANAESF